LDKSLFGYGPEVFTFYKTAFGQPPFRRFNFHMKRYAFFFGYEGDNNHKPRWPLVKQVYGNHEARSFAGLLVPSGWI
jgi:hypothetical protein